MSKFREKVGTTDANSQVQFSSRTASQLAAAVEKAMTTPQLDELARLAWSAFSEALISERETETITDRIQALRAIKKAVGQGTLPLRPKLPLVRPRNPSERISRRRRIAASGAIPSTLAVHYTPHQLAVVSAIVSLLRQNRILEKTLQEIGDIAGVCRKTVQRSLVIARALNHLHVEERRVSKDRNLPHRITIGSDLLLRKWISSDADRPYRRGWVTGESIHTKQVYKTPPERHTLRGTSTVLLNRVRQDRDGLDPMRRSDLFDQRTSSG